MTAFLYHFHGIGGFDFSSMSPDDVKSIQSLAGQRDLEILPTVYLRRENLSRLRDTMQAFSELSQAGDVPNIAGFGIEGPLLGPDGGIPRRGKWYPTADEWAQLAELGSFGLKYVVMAPDAMDLDDPVGDGLTFSELLCRFYDNGVRIGVGHYHRDNPHRSALRLEHVLDHLHLHYESSPFLVLTDHLYNDMPRNFVHAWRSKAAMGRRVDELAQVMAPRWTRETLPDLLGPVPAAMLNAALDGRLMPCLNFDGRHVDLAICRRTIDYLGADRLIALTDHIEVDTMAGEPLTQDAHSGLRLRDDGAVAAGSSGYTTQRANMLSIGLNDHQVQQLFYRNPKAAIEFRPARQASSV
ncbi:hypothetical protein [Streptomyces sp. NPDC002602]|uniref:hypothetical protein n=1 Tax=Streptomyces sp. NPDC002602 TaxID=3364654 RepID=UPI0036B7F116